MTLSIAHPSDNIVHNTNAPSNALPTKSISLIPSVVRHILKPVERLLKMLWSISVAKRCKSFMIWMQTPKLPVVSLNEWALHSSFKPGDFTNNIKQALINNKGILPLHLEDYYTEDIDLSQYVQCIASELQIGAQSTIGLLKTICSSGHDTTTKKIMYKLEHAFHQSITTEQQHDLTDLELLSSCILESVEILEKQTHQIHEPILRSSTQAKLSILSTAIYKIKKIRDQQQSVNKTRNEWMKMATDIHNLTPSIFEIMQNPHCFLKALKSATNTRYMQELNSLKLNALKQEIGHIENAMMDLLDIGLKIEQNYDPMFSSEIIAKQKEQVSLQISTLASQSKTTQDHIQVLETFRSLAPLVIDNASTDELQDQASKCVLYTQAFYSLYEDEETINIAQQCLQTTMDSAYESIANKARASPISEHLEILQRWYDNTKTTINFYFFI